MAHKSADATRLLEAESEREYLVELHEQLVVAQARALKANSFVAASKLLSQALEIKRAILALDSEAAANAKTPRSEEDLVSLLTERLSELPTPYLEMAVTEYLRRHPGARVVVDG